MAGKPMRRTRRYNVDVPLDLTNFTRRLLSALKWRGEFNEQAPLRPSSFIWTGPETHDTFGIRYLIDELYSKFDDGLPSPDKERATWERFRSAEELCRITNERLIYDKSRHGTSVCSVESIIASASRKISHILGPFNWDEAARRFAFGPGATTRLPRRRRDTAYKYSGIPETTSGNLALATAAITAVPLWKQSLDSQGVPHAKVVVGNKVTTVPKNWKTDRVIAIEPDMNMYVQKGIGAVMRSRLKRHGVDLDDQTRNQVLARDGIELGLSTIDLSMASDTVSYELVRLLLPADWFSAIELCRSPIGVLPSGERILYRKFSSMGNGYTFELETVIFYGLCLAVAEAYGLKVQNITVYGDDIIFPSEGYHHLKDILSYCGFVVNDKKSHHEGPFRESCGKHYYHGRDVSPFYIKRSPKTLKELFLLHNQLYRWCRRNKDNWVWHRGEMRNLIHYLRSLAPRAWRKPQLPDDFGDGAFMGTFDEVRPSLARRGWEGYRCSILADVSSSYEIDQIGRYLKSLHRLEMSSSHDDVEGGVSLPPRVRRLEIVVPRFAGEDPFLLLLPLLRGE